MRNHKEGLLTPKGVIESLEVGASTVAAVTTLVFAMTGGTARADDRFPILGSTKHQILSDTQLDQVHGTFFIADGVYLKDGEGFIARLVSSPNPLPGYQSVYREVNDANQTLWDYDPKSDKIALHSDPSLTATGTRYNFMTQNSAGDITFRTPAANQSMWEILWGINPAQ